MSRQGDQRNDHKGTVALMVGGILSGYPFIPDIETNDTTKYSEQTNTRNQTNSDLELVTQLAGEHRYEFWIDCTTTPAMRGGPDRRDRPFQELAAARQRVLPSAVRCSAAGQTDPPDEPRRRHVDAAPSRRTTCPRSTASRSIRRVNVNPEKSRGAVATGPRWSRSEARRRSQFTSVRSSPRAPIEEAQKRNDAALIDASWVVKATAKFTVYALGAALQPHDVVQVAGTGAVDDGSYFVWSVSHHIDPADHKMRCELRRNAVGEAQ